MDAFATDNLFLLEFLVDFVNLEYGMQQDLLSMSGETCVSFQFLDNAPLYVSEEDFDPGHKNIGDPCGITNSTIKNGKSCIFSLSPTQAENGQYEFNIYLEVFKKMNPGTLPDKISLGETLISIVTLFNDLVSAVKNSNNVGTPVTKTLKDTYKIYNASGDLAGNVGVYLRMSCFGKLIVTQFQMNLQDNSVEFKAKEGHYLFKYNKKDGGCPETCGQESTNCYPPCKKESSNCGSNPYISNQQYGSTPPNSQCFQQQPMKLNSSDYQHIQPACPYQPPPSGTSKAQFQTKCLYGSSKPSLVCKQTMKGNTYCQPPTPPPCLDPCQQYQLQMQQLQQMQMMNNMETPCYECSPPPPPSMANDPDDNYEEIGATMGGNSLLIRVHKDKQKVESIMNDDDNRCCCANTNDSQSLKPDKSNKPNPPMCFRLGAGGPAGQSVCIQPPTTEAPCGTQVTQLNDPDKEQFILRIGKKSEGFNKKNNFEVELCTPKGKDLKPPPKFETRDTQCEENKEESKNKAGKGKGGKADKKKKGKK